MKLIADQIVRFGYRFSFFSRNWEFGEIPTYRIFGFRYLAAR
jgi:hypothetical protein